MAEIDKQLRDILYHLRSDRETWKKTDRRGRPRGLTQQELADEAGISLVWYRQIESGYEDHAGAALLGRLMQILGLDSAYLRQLGYVEIADAMDAPKITEQIRNGHVPVAPTPGQLAEQQREHLERTPGLTGEQKKLLLKTLQEIRMIEPLGHDIWQRES